MSAQSTGGLTAAITLLLAADLMFAAAEPEPPPSDKPGGEWTSPHDRPVTPGTAQGGSHAGSEAYESAMAKARDRLDGDHRVAADEYRAVLQPAMITAMQADDLTEANRLDRVIKGLDGGVRQYRMEALRRRLEKTAWSATPDSANAWEFLPDGRFRISSDKKPSPSSTWEVVDVNTIMAGTHPTLWTITVAADLRSLHIFGGSRDRGFQIELARAGAPRWSVGRPDDDFESREIRRARQQYDQTLTRALQRYQQTSSTARTIYREALDAALASAMESADLAEANTLDKIIKSLDDSSICRKTLTRTIAGTTWRSEKGSGPRFSFRPDGTYVYEGRQGGEWSAIDDNTIRVWNAPHLWLITFNEDRSRTHLRGTDGSPRLDLWLGRATDP